ncbi:GNAT family N-acetyltransferase [Niveibacterium sp. SC-1]|uniref:GNAT family N-acetyltransferase n=1 Tax=Niveibacterium sp. SC-1 TaxID=3135646 RepID=UPI00311E09B6
MAALAFDPRDLPAALLAPHDPRARLAEQAGLAAMQVAEEARYDGWLLRTSPGRAKRARCITALAAGTLDLDTKLGHCARVYADAGLPLIFRVTPFSEPGLDLQLAARGFTAFEETRVMIRDLRDLPARDPANLHRVDAARFVEGAGQLYGDPLEVIDADRRRAEAFQGIAIRFLLGEDSLQPWGAGSALLDGAMAGLYGLFVSPARRGQGAGRALVLALMRAARDAGASDVCLQVSAGNTAARALYARLGFVDHYAYWYRVPSPPAA